MMCKYRRQYVRVVVPAHKRDRMVIPMPTACNSIQLSVIIYQEILSAGKVSKRGRVGLGRFVCKNFCKVMK